MSAPRKRDSVEPTAQKPLAGRVAVVTGGDRGIGFSIARAMQTAGAALAIGARDRRQLEQAAAELRATDCLVNLCDVRDSDSVEMMARNVHEQFGRADVVVANAGDSGPTKPMVETNLDEWDDCINTNLTGVFLTFRAFVPSMMSHGSGSLIAVSSLTGKRPLSGRTAYAASKMGIIGLVRSLAVEVGASGIRVNAVCPGFVKGPRLDGGVARLARLRGISEDAARQEFTDLSPLHRFVTADEVAAACVFLASDDASAITGEDLNVSAGVVMY